MPTIIIGAALSGVVAGIGYTAAAGLTFGFSWAAFTSTLLLGGMPSKFQSKSGGCRY